VFEPRSTLADLPLGRRESTVSTRGALDAGRAGQALEISGDKVGMPPLVAKLSRVLSLSPRFRSQLIPGQIADQEAVERLGDRLTAYGGITQHVLVAVGTKSPEHLPRRAEVLRDKLRSSEFRRMEGASHGAPVNKAAEFGQLLIADIDTQLGEARHVEVGVSAQP
jgi:pimeloyl-ACP methyl ester carboxylesterase